MNKNLSVGTSTLDEKKVNLCVPTVTYEINQRREVKFTLKKYFVSGIFTLLLKVLCIAR